MFAVERTRVIRKYLEEHRKAETHTLSELLDVSEVTVRRDLERLEQEGVLLRTHGGAVIRITSYNVCYTKLLRLSVRLPLIFFRHCD